MIPEKLPLLGSIAGALRWLEELITILSGPLLTAGLAIALVDLLTDGRLLASQPALLYAWAISQAIGVDGQLVGAAVKAGRAARSGRWRHTLAYGVLIAALGYVAYLASNVFATQQALGLTTAQALARLGMGDTNWIVTRSLLAVVLVILSGLLRYDPPKLADSTASERERLQAELELEPLRAQLRARKALGWRAVGQAVIGHDAATASVALPNASQDAQQPTTEPSAHDSASATPQVAERPLSASDVPPDKPPTGGGSPASAPGTHRRQRPMPVIRLTPDTPRRRAAASGRARGANTRPVRTATVEAKVRAAWQPGMTVSQLERTAGISRSAAGKWRKVLMAEASRAQAAR